MCLGLGIGDLNLPSPILKTPIPNSKHQLVILLPIGDFHFKFSIAVIFGNCGSGLVVGGGEFKFGGGS